MTDSMITTIERYLDAWNETDPATRRAAIDDVAAADVRYTDPLASVTGRDALDGLIGSVQQQFPGLRFTIGGPIDAHHDQARFTWHLSPSTTLPQAAQNNGGEPVVVGFDVIHLDSDGRIRAVLGFLDKVPS